MNHQYWVERRERMRERRRVCELTEQSRERTAKEQAVERTAWTERVLIIKRLQDHCHSGVSCTQTRADTGRTCSRCMPVQNSLPKHRWYHQRHGRHLSLTFPITKHTAIFTSSGLCPRVDLTSSINPLQSLFSSLFLILLSSPGVGALLIVSELTLNVKEGLFLLSNSYLEYTLRI